MADTTTAADTQQPANAPGAAGAPTSYKDATYDQLDAATAKQTGIPAWLLPSIRTQGEKSNNDQVSDKGAQTVYQITPTTRQLAIKAYGIDPYLSASNASLVAGKLLADSMQRNNGSVPQAVGEYIGGTNRTNWGTTTNAYIKRVLQGAGGTPVGTQTGGNPYAAAQASADETTAGVGKALSGVNANNANLPAGPSIAKLVDAYNSGAMDPQAAADFQHDVDNGKVFLPTGIKLNAPQTTGQQGLDANPQIVPITSAEAANAQAQQAPQSATPAAMQANQAAAPQAVQQPAQAAPQAVPLKVVQAYQSGQMDPQAKADFEADIKAGKITLPPAQTPQEQGFLSQVGRQLGLFTRDAIQAVGNTVGIGADPIGATINTLTGSHLQTAGSLANTAANALGLPTPANDRERLVNQGTEAGLGGLSFAGGAKALAGGLEGALGQAAARSGTAGAEAAAQRAATATAMQPAAGSVGATARGATEALAAGPAAQTTASAAGGAAGEQAKQAGAGPLVQTAANISAAMVSPSRVGGLLKNGAEMLGQRVAPEITAKIAGIAADDQQPLRQAAQDVAQSIQNTPKTVAFDPSTGEITKEGRELSILSGLTPEGLRKAYGKLETATAGGTANAAVDEGKQFGIEYTQGQAEKNFAQQDKEQTLAKAATPEGDQARAYFDNQQQQINHAVENFRTAFGDTGATASERGAQVQEAVTSMRNQGDTGVTAFYKQARGLAGEPVPLESQPILDAAATAITARPTEPGIKQQIASVLAKYGLLGGDITERGPFGNTVTSNGKSYDITGEVTPLSLSNAENMRQALNTVFRADKTGHTGGVIAALDDSVENAVGKIAQRSSVEAPEVGQQMTHTPAGGEGQQVAYVGPGEAPGTSRVSAQPAAAPTPEALTAQNSAIAAERDQLAAQRAQTGTAATPAEKALSAASGSASAKERAAALQWAQANDRPDVVRAVLSNARADAETAAKGAAPKNTAMMAVQQKAVQQLEKSAADLHAAAGEPYGAAAEKTVPTVELSGGSQAGAEQQAAFEQGRAARRVQARTYEAKDIIQDLADLKTGTLTPKLLPENVFTPLLNNPTNLRKAKNVLLAQSADSTVSPSAMMSGIQPNTQAWRAIQAQALANIMEDAKNPQTGGITGARLNSALNKMGDEKLKILFDPKDYTMLKSLQSAINRTVPLSGTVNTSNTFTKLYNMVAKHLSDSIAGAGTAVGAAVGGPVGGMAGAAAGKSLGLIAEKVQAARESNSALKSIVNPNAVTAKAAQTAADRANRDLINTLIDASKRNSFVPYGITHSNDPQQDQ